MTAVSQEVLDAFKRQARPWLVELIRNTVPAASSGGAASAPASRSHSDLSNLGADDHTHYLTTGRGDLRYVPLSRLVTAGAGLAGGGALSANVALSLSTPGTLDSTTSNSATGAHTHAVTAEYDVSAGGSALLRSNAGNLRLATLHAATLTTASGDQTASPVGNFILTPGGFVRLSDGKALRTATYSSGFTGSGFMLDQGVTDTGRTSLTVDNLWVRGRMHVYELLIHQIRATNGSIFVSNTGKVVAVVPGVPPAYHLTTDPEHGFAAGDLIRAQRFTGSGVYQSNMQVTSVGDSKTFYANLISGDAPAAGMDFVRLGSATDANRRGGLYLTADDSGAPFMDIFDGVDAHADWNTAGVIKARLGSLAGLGIGSAGEYGLFVGTGQALTDKYLKASTAGVTQVNVDSTWYSSGTKYAEITAADGITLYTGATSWENLRGYTFHSGSMEYGGLYGWSEATLRYVGLRSRSDTVHEARVWIEAEHLGGGDASFLLNAKDGTRYTTLYGWTDLGGSTIARLDAYNGSTLTRLQLNASTNEAAILGNVNVTGRGTFSGAMTAASYTTANWAAFNGGLITIQYSSAPYYGVSIRAATGSGWDRGFFFNDGTSKFGGFGANGAAGALDHYYIGPNYGASAYVLVRQSDGFVGIGTNVPGQRLHVSGNVLAQAYRATTDPGAGTAGQVIFLNASNWTIGSGVGNVRMTGSTARTNVAWLKVYIGTTACWIPVWDNIT